MKEVMIIKSLFVFIIFWGAGIVLLWFRPRIEIIWKAAATLLFALTTWFFYEEIKEGYSYFTSGWYTYILLFVKELLVLVFVNMFFFWPLALVIIFYKADDMGAERLLKFLCILTVVLWILFIVYSIFDRGIDAFFLESLKGMVPGAGR
jgi:hypothetical protein